MIAIVTDSSCDLDENLIEKYNINMIPLRIVFNDKEYRDRFEITNKEIYERMETEIPTTSLPVPQDILDTFERLKKEGYTEIIAICISSELSGTYNVMKNISESFETDIKMHIIDSKQVSMGLGYTVLAAAIELEKSGNAASVLSKIEEISSGVNINFVVGTLDYLKKGGRIGHLSGTIGELLQIKPILYLDNGALSVLKKVKGRNKSIKALTEVAVEGFKADINQVTVVHADDIEEAANLANELKENKKVKAVKIVDVSAVLGVHTGRGLIGIVSAPYFEY